VLTPKVAGRAEGGRVAAEVRRQLVSCANNSLNMS
jgi:hypothetical protein